MMFTRVQIVSGIIVVLGSILLSFVFGYLSGRFVYADMQKFSFEFVDEVNPGRK